MSTRIVRPARRLLLACALGSLLSLQLAGCDKSAPGKAEAPPAAQPSAPPTIAGSVVSFAGGQDPAGLRVVGLSVQADRPVTLPGRLAWDEDHTARVYAPYAGRVERLRVAVGDTVRAGQVLAEISSADIGAAQSDLHKAQVDQALAAKAVARTRELAEAGVIARKELDQAEADAARAGADVARTRARLAQYGITGDTLSQSFGLKSPLAGTVVERNSNPGSEVRTDVAGAPLFTISDPSTLWAALDVDESQLALVRRGQTLTLTTAAWPGERFEAQVMTLGEAVDPASRTVKLRARVANPRRLLKAEMFVAAELGQSERQLRVPADAVFLRGERQAVFVRVAPGRFERREVDLRPAGPQFWSVVKGLGADDKVVLGGALFLNQLLDSAP